MTVDLQETDLAERISQVLIEKIRPGHPDFDWGYVSLEWKSAGLKEHSVATLVIGAFGLTGSIELLIDWVDRGDVCGLLYATVGFRLAPPERWAGIASEKAGDVEIQITRVDQPAT